MGNHLVSVGPCVFLQACVILRYRRMAELVEARAEGARLNTDAKI
jgi:hypothetical protein